MKDKLDIKNFLPLIMVVLFCLLQSIIQSIRTEAHFMDSFMGYFFLYFALFKLFDIKGFVEGFSSYDIMAKKFSYYGYAYPFIELLLGVAYLLHCKSSSLYWVTIFVMFISAIGVLKAIIKKQKINCACMGTVLKVPLTSVSFVENIGMGIMAIYMLVK